MGSLIIVPDLFTKEAAGSCGEYTREGKRKTGTVGPPPAPHSDPHLSFQAVGRRQTHGFPGLITWGNDSQ